MASLERSEEVQLARDLAAGRPGAFEKFVNVFRTKIFQYSLLMCGHREDAEEVAQDTLMKVFQNFEQLREPERVRPWVFRIARNACFMKRRKSVFAPAQELSLDELMPGHDGGERRLEIADWSDLPDTQVLRSELGDTLRAAIEELPEIYKSVILLRDVEELTTGETAETLDVSEEVVKTRLHRARLAVRKKLDGYLRSAQASGPAPEGVARDATPPNPAADKSTRDSRAPDATPPTGDGSTPATPSSARGRKGQPPVPSRDRKGAV